MIDVNLLWVSIGSAAMAFIYAMSVYFSKTEEEDWDWEKALTTSILGGVVGFAVSFFSVSDVSVMNSPYYAFAGIVAERVAKILKRKFIPWLEKIIGELDENE